VLFLFVVMMLDIDFATLRAGFMKYMPLGAAVGLVLLIEIVLLATHWADASQGAFPANPNPGLTNTAALGQVLYTDYILVFQTTGLVLLTAMIGAIVLTLRHKPDARRQNIAAQVARRRAEGVEVVSVKSGQGVSHP
jgi:NADH-quinone oxidoreductase subunit J